MQQAASLAKLNMPRLARGIARPRLFKMLDEGRRAAATWIAAPGGAGKTTLAATYLIERKLPYLWYQLDQDDGDPATFFYYLHIAARQALPGREIHLPLLTPEYLPDIPGFARRYFRRLFSLLPPQTVLILDNYQDADNGRVFVGLLGNLLSEIPQGIHLVVISRSALPSELAQCQINALDWESLRLTLEETRAIVAFSGRPEERLAQALHKRADGWAAGVTLLLGHSPHEVDGAQALKGASLEAVFDFFASEFFNAFSPDIRDFLLKTSLLAHVPPSIASAVSGNRQAAQILDDLYRRSIFIDRHDLDEVSYRYHPLFREFLLNKVAAEYFQHGDLEPAIRAGEVLYDRGRQEEAIALYLQVRAWETVVPLILDQAPRLLAQGRAQIVLGWLNKVPDELVEALPWLLYWKGISEQFTNPFEARAILERAHAGFVAKNDDTGQMLVASALIDSAWFLRLNFALLHPWIDVLKSKLALQQLQLPPGTEARILTTLISVLTFSRPQDPELSHHAERLLALLDENLIINQKIYAAGHLLYYHALLSGKLEICGHIRMRIADLIEAPEVTVVNEIFWRHMCILPLVLEGRVAEANDLNSGVQALIEKNNLAFLKPIAAIYDVILHINLGNSDMALTLLDEIAPSLNSAQPLDAAWFHFLKFMYALSLNDQNVLWRFGQESFRRHMELDMISTAMAIGCILAMADCESRNPEKVMDYLAAVKSRGLDNMAFIHHQVLLAEAYAALLSSDVELCHERLRQALLVIDKRPSFGQFFFWFPRRAVSRLCGEALRAGVEPEFFCNLIRRYKLMPEDDSITTWPWPVRIHTQGHFKVEVNGRAISSSESHSKPLALLKALITFGANEVKIERIAEILWPNAEGDAAISAFTTTASRLRKLIGDEAIMVKAGRVTLNAYHCWVDVRVRDLDAVDVTQKETISKPLDWQGLDNNEEPLR